MTNKNKHITESLALRDMEKDGFIKWVLEWMTRKKVEVTEIKDYLPLYEKEHIYYQDIHIRAEYGGKEHYWLMVYDCENNSVKKITEENQEEYEHVK